MLSCRIETSMEPIRTGLRNIVNEVMRAQPPEEAVPLTWPLVCGNDVAQRTRALAFSDGKLTVLVTDPGWRTQLIGFASRYVAVFNELMGPLVQEVRFVAKEHSAVNTHGEAGQAQQSAKQKDG